ncbi:hypothetical protein DO021_21695 [Desulfobacter hydrogenophilus]|uniref:AraC family transcriptional regulator n=1 Tax=Desulfobacter hydrogenophilus TaxID=2291 RepID=A0A328FA36_9BACT|nr:AraC family transcriptional regulator [Desulfobacter hydrogenophilus]NDY74494.1 helix-turn-helix transcriptional regulator [Desulfobacter hydrogenophilus]QBH15167.1 AraC family transcriptional regulator [Desulfobacter hydrogenophilus]RAL99942.1 hypothetical protein DO021_21695 [Desulfobacter hydrogenophilus]
MNYPAFFKSDYTYLQKVKMEKAWYLLREGDMSVTEVAGEVGDTNISHFAAPSNGSSTSTPGH